MYTYIWEESFSCLSLVSLERLLSYIRIYGYIYPYVCIIQGPRSYICFIQERDSSHIYVYMYLSSCICITQGLHIYVYMYLSSWEESLYTNSDTYTRIYVYMYHTGAEVVYVHHTRERLLSYIRIYGYIDTYVCIPQGLRSYICTMQERDSSHI